MKFLHKKVTSSLILGCIITTLILAPVTPQGSLNEAEAQRAVVVLGGRGTVQETISAGANMASVGLQTALNLKELTLDGIAHALAKMVLRSMTQSILNWINSGFQGSPAFVTDLKQLLRDRVDEAIGEFIYNDPALSFLCSPFQLDVRIALATSYQEDAYGGLGSKAQCTLSQVTDNVEGFLNGSFQEGGWESWFEVTQNPVNTPTGAMLAAETEMYARIVDEEGRTVKELDWGDGFLSFKVCADTARQQNCDITTPGKVIADQVNKSLGAGQDALITADEINEIIAALFSQLAQQAITGVGGLLGLGGGSSSSFSDNRFGADGNSSYLDALGEENAQPGGVANPFTDALTRENTNTNLQNQVIDAIDAVETRLDAAITAEPTCVSLTLPTSLTNQRDAAEAQIARNTASVATLTAMNNTFVASTDPQQRLDLATQLSRMQQDGTLVSFTANNVLQVNIQFELTQEIQAFDTQIRSALNGCRGR